MRDCLLASITLEGCEKGSWMPSDQFGRIQSTALGALVLETYYRFHQSIPD